MRHTAPTEPLSTLARSSVALPVRVRLPTAGFMSNSGMDTPASIDQRLTDLEIKSSYAEDLLDTLNQALFRQQEQIDLLLREVRELRRQSAAAPPAGTLREDLPPHY